MGIYSYELFNFYDIDNIIRIGTAGSIHPDLKIRNVVLAMGACTDSNYGADSMSCRGPLPRSRPLSSCARQSK